MTDKLLENIYNELKKNDPNYNCPHIYYAKEILTADTGDLICINCKEADFAPNFKEIRQKRIEKMLIDYEKIKK